MQKKTVCMMGLGYIGLPTAALLANRKYHVHGVDVVQSTVDTINQGKIHIVEPDLDTFVRSAVNSGNLIADTKPKESDVFIIAVPTPFHEGYVPNIDYVISATESIAPYVKEGNIVILESTSPVGTTEKISQWLSEIRPDLNFPHQSRDHRVHATRHRGDTTKISPSDLSTMKDSVSLLFASYSNLFFFKEFCPKVG